jgi:antitoxin (DNA-binding transcriptional repressor) of toxin-antitoxin stability system
MKTIAAVKFREQCLAILDDVDAEGIIITKRGKPVAKLTRLDEGSDGYLIGSLNGRLKVRGDILSTTGIRWDAES